MEKIIELLNKNGLTTEEYKDKFSHSLLVYNNGENIGEISLKSGQHIFKEPISKELQTAITEYIKNK